MGGSGRVVLHAHLLLLIIYVISIKKTYLLLVNPNKACWTSTSCIFLGSVIGEKKVGRKYFPDDFQFGVSTSAYQIEGAWDVDGKGTSMWDFMVRTDPKRVVDGTNGDVACNSYYLYKKDVEMLTELGVNSFRFSIAWTRILPFGTLDYVNHRGIAHYNKLLDELLANGIQPFVTIYHWDLPQRLNEKGGWLNEQIVDSFGDYARILFKYFGNRVKYWLTINEPKIHCYLGYGIVYHAPGIHSPGIAYYECIRNLLLAHAKVYHIYDKEFRETQGGKVGLAINFEWPVTESNSENDTEALQDFMAFNVDICLQPIFSKQGNFPERFIKRIADASARQGYNESRLRPFTQDQVNDMKGSADFLGLNHYTSRVVYRNESLRGTFEVPSVEDDLGVGMYADPSWPRVTDVWLFEYAPGLYNLLMFLKNSYGNPEIYVTENGLYTEGMTSLIDDARVQYYRNYLSALLDAVYDGVNVKGYFPWTLMDNFEWANGFTSQFGLYSMDINDGKRTTRARKSALVYKEIIRSRVVDYDYDVDPYAVRSAGGVHTPRALTIIILGLLILYIDF